MARRHSKSNLPLAEQSAAFATSDLDWQRAQLDKWIDDAVASGALRRAQVNTNVHKIPAGEKRRLLGVRDVSHETKNAIFAAWCLGLSYETIEDRFGVDSRATSRIIKKILGVDKLPRKAQEPYDP